VQTLTENLIEQGLRDRILSERQLERAIGGAAARRYGLVNRALKANELTRIRRGLYVLAPRYRTEPAHPFAIAQALIPSSYISFETALAHHAWIPEAVLTTASVVPGRKSTQVDHPSLGSFTFHPLALDRRHYLELVDRHQFGHQAALVASPLRALMDLVCLRKRTWQGMDWLVEGLRIDAENLRSLTRADIDVLTNVHTQQRPKAFLRALAKELSLD
jgi:hypothetical protein